MSQGSVDIPLNATGIAQARDAAARLAGRGIASIVASPMSRARDTAAPVAAALGLPVEIESDLREVSFGAHEGHEMGDWFDSWIAGEITPEGGESFPDLRQRGVAALARALARPAPVLVVAHGALFRALRSAMGVSPNARLANGAVMHCAPPDSGDAWTLTPV